MTDNNKIGNVDYEFLSTLFSPKAPYLYWSDGHCRWSDCYGTEWSYPGEIEVLAGPRHRRVLRRVRGFVRHDGQGRLACDCRTYTGQGTCRHLAPAAVLLETVPGVSPKDQALAAQTAEDPYRIAARESLAAGGLANGTVDSVIDYIERSVLETANGTKKG